MRMENIMQSLSPKVGLVILAAGASTRLGQPKQLLMYKGRSLLSHAVEVAIASLCQPIVVVLGYLAEQLQLELAEYPVQIAQNRSWIEGMGTSISVGVQALTELPTNIEAVILMVCDQPFVSAELLNHLVTQYTSTNCQIVASAYGATRGVPALFSQTQFLELISLNADQGAKQIIKRQKDKLIEVPFPAGEIDIDTLDDYQQYCC